MNILLPTLTTGSTELTLRQRFIILFLDGQKFHMTLAFSEFCVQNGIVLYILPPNTTQILPGGCKCI